MTQPAFDQDSFRGRNDDDNEADATWKALANTDWNQNVDETFRLRFVIQETDGKAAADKQYKVQRNLEAAGWVDITTSSSVVKAVGSANTTWTLTDEDATTQQVGAGTFFTGAWNDDNVAGESSQLDFSGNDETELEFCLQIVGADVSNEDTIDIQVVESDDTALDVYTNTPTITADKIEITSVTPSEFDDLDTGVVVAGDNFEASQGTGKVELGDSSVYASANKQEQTVTAWGNTSITFTCDLGTLGPGTRWVFVTNDSGATSDGSSVTVHRAEAFQMAASANIAASGENTTVQLAAPGGKTTGDFDAGRIQDDENPADAVDITLDDYTEMEWCIKAVTNARDVQYNFRVTVGGTPLGVYTVTPQLTIPESVGRTTRNTDTHPLGIHTAMGWRVGNP